ncbi:MAG: MerR family transcriptional regulator [Candidatus Omnitrophota bacterium]|jgi:MerR family transcriptional regulator/heat shock protein HspR|nr:MerR family transcriptional regulator [Candidatus Omnitrophota bacterium]
MDWEEIEEQFDLQISEDEPVFPVSVVCSLLHMQYYMLHEIMKEGVIRESKKEKNKKLFSRRDVKRLKYIQYLVEERGVNIKGVKVILELRDTD